MVSDRLISSEKLHMLDHKGYVVESIKYRSGTYAVQGYIVQPFSVPEQDKKYPVIIFNRGGCGDIGALSEEYIQKRLGLFASRGYVVLASQYRGNSFSDGHDEIGGADVEDIVALYELAHELSYCDMDRVGMIGGSRGGMMMCRFLQQRPHIRAAISLAGLMNMQRLLDQREDVRELYAQHFELTEENIRMRSPVRRVEELPKTVPFLLMHGRCDRRVSPLDALEIAQQFYEHRIPHKLVMFPGAEHRLIDVREEVDYEIRTFLDKYVKNNSLLPSTEPFGE